MAFVQSCGCLLSTSKKLVVVVVLLLGVVGVVLGVVGVVVVVLVVVLVAVVVRCRRGSFLLFLSSSFVLVVLFVGSVRWYLLLL